MISDLRPVSNESPNNSTLFRGIYKFLNPFIFEKNNGFLKFMLNFSFLRKFCEMATAA